MKTQVSHEVIKQIKCRVKRNNQRPQGVGRHLINLKVPRAGQIWYPGQIWYDGFVHLFLRLKLLDGFQN